MVVRPYFTEQKQVLPFDKLLELEKINDSTYRSIVKAYSPTGAENGTYGGHVFAQAAWAAAQTVDEGFVIHNITGWFLVGGNPDEHYTYTVTALRNGRSYSMRSVTATQPSTTSGATFTCTASFKLSAPPSPVSTQPAPGPRQTYASVLAGKENDPMQHPPTPSTDSAYFTHTYLPAHPHHFNPLPGLHMRKADMAAFNAAREPTEKRQLTFYTLRGALPAPTAPYPLPPLRNAGGLGTGVQVTRAANLHACVHLYASDRNSLFLVPAHLGRPRGFTRMASLAHSVVFHVGIEELVALLEPRIAEPRADATAWGDDEGVALCSLESVGEGRDTNDGRDAEGRKWWVQEAWVERAGGGRALHVSRLWDWGTGVHVATTFQDGLVRFGEGAVEGRGKL